MKGPNERYHDRVAPRYDDIYAKDAYWSYYFDVGWRHLRRFLPTDLGKPALDAGCGTGLYGLRLVESGYRVVFSDLSAGMLERAARNAEAAFPGRPHTFVKSDLETLDGHASATYGFMTAQGDPLSFVSDPRRALKSMARVLVPGGVAVCSVDSRFGGVEPFFTRDDLDGLEAFLRTGDAEWLADRKEERFPTHAFTPDELKKLGDAAGLETIDVIGKTCFHLRDNHPWLVDRERRRKLLDIEAKWGASAWGLGRAHHLQVVWRKPKEAPSP